MAEVNLTKYGFDYGPICVERAFSSERGVVISLRPVGKYSPRCDVYLSNGGRSMQIHAHNARKVKNYDG